MKKMRPPQRNAKPATTSWEPVSKWYHGIVGEEGHYYHRQIIIPGVLKLLDKPKALLDLACGNGILAKHLPETADYLGVDISATLIKSAKQSDGQKNHVYQIADVTKPLKLPRADFSHATLILAAQNMEEPKLAFENAAKHLGLQGKFVVVLNHPCFRIPRQSSWGIDDEKKIQYRRVDRYMSSMKIPIHAHPGKGENSPATLSFHYSLTHLILWLNEAGFAIESIEEWCSDKTSTGKNAKMENRSREEIPLFLAIKAFKMK
jgi:ubiquinone/menaquinone biosynthesis C-methylase UbiE